MTTRERFVKALTGQPVDRVPFIKVFGGDNAVLPSWEKEDPGPGKDVDRLLQFEGGYRGWRITPVNTGCSQPYPEKIIKDTGDRVVVKDSIGRTRVAQRELDFHGSYVEWPVRTRTDWHRFKERHLQPDDPDRFPKDWPDHVAGYANRDFPLQLTHGGVYGFARNIMGDEHLALAFYDDPDMVHDILETYTEMAIAVWSKMVPDVEFDLIECWEDMASKNGCLISPKTFREFCSPIYRRIAEFARQHRIPIILVDSDGYIEDLTGLMLESGVTTLYPFEVQAGNDLFRVREKYPAVGAIGGLDKNVMARGEKAIQAELDKARRLIRQGRFIPGPDHFVLSDVSWKQYRYFMEQLREAVMTTPVGTDR